MNFSQKIHTWVDTPLVWLDTYQVEFQRIWVCLEWVDTSCKWVDSFLVGSTQSERCFQRLDIALNVSIHWRNVSIHQANGSTLPCLESTHYETFFSQIYYYNISTLFDLVLTHSTYVLIHLSLESIHSKLIFKNSILAKDLFLLISFLHIHIHIKILIHASFHRLKPRRYKEFPSSSTSLDAFINYT